MLISPLTSPSQMNLFFACSRRWLYNKQGKRGIVTDDSALVFGKTVHNAIEEFFRKVPDHPSADEIESIAKKVFGEYDRQMIRERKQRLERIRDNFISFEKKRMRTWKHYKPTLVEEKLKSSQFVGILDFYSKEEGVAIDWKTGSSMMSPNHLRQGKIYELLLRENNYTVKKVIFFSLESGMALPVPRVTDGWIQKELDRMRNEIEQGRFFANRGPLCGWCPYILDCDFGETDFWRLANDRLQTLQS